MEGVFHFLPKCPGAYTRWGLLRILPKTARVKSLIALFIIQCRIFIFRTVFSYSGRKRKDPVVFLKTSWFSCVSENFSLSTRGASIAFGKLTSFLFFAKGLITYVDRTGPVCRDQIQPGFIWSEPVWHARACFGAKPRFGEKVVARCTFNRDPGIVPAM